MTGVLQGIRVLDFGRYIAGPFASAILADMGADVIRIDPPGGAEDAFMLPVGPNQEGANYLLFSKCKRSLTLDFTSELGRPVLDKLISTADVVVANVPPAAMIKLGIDYDRLKSINPRIILGSSYGFFKEGPYANRLGFDAVAQAMSGAVMFSGRPGDPMKIHAPYCDYGTGLALANGILAALFHRERTGEGQSVETSLVHTGVVFMGQWLLEQQLKRPNRTPIANQSQMAAPADLFRTSDGWIQIFIKGDQFKRWARLVGEDAWADDTRFSTDEGRVEHRLLLNARAQEWFDGHSTTSAMEALERARIPAAPALDLDGVLKDPHFQATSFGPEVCFDDSLRMKLLSPIVKFPQQTLPSVPKVPPKIGAHSEEILRSIGLEDVDLRNLSTAGII